RPAYLTSFSASNRPASVRLEKVRSMRRTAPPYNRRSERGKQRLHVVRKNMHDPSHFATDNTMRTRSLAAVCRISVRVRRDRGQVISFGLFSPLPFLVRPAALFVFAPN